MNCRKENDMKTDKEQVMRAFIFHKSTFENWQEGNPVDYWRDDEGNLCITYESGKWWHYREADGCGEITFW